MKQPDFGKKIAERRKELGLTQEDVANNCKINVRTVQRIEAGEVNPQMYTIKMLADTLDFEKGIFYKEKVQKLKEFYEHLAIYLIVNFTIIITSSNSNFEFSPLNKHTKEINEYAINKYEISSIFGKPFNINGHGIIQSIQINLPDSISEYIFSINNQGFSLVGNNLFRGRNNWYLQPNDPLEINADLID